MAIGPIYGPPAPVPAPPFTPLFSPRQLFPMPGGPAPSAAWQPLGSGQPRQLFPTPQPQLTPAPDMFTQPRPVHPSPPPTPSMNSMNQAAREAVREQRLASKPYRPSQARLATMEPTRGGYTAGEAAQLGRMATGPDRPMPGGPRVGPNPPSTVSQGVRGAGGAGANLSEGVAAAQARAGGGMTATLNGRPNPQVGSSLMQAMTGQAPAPPGIASTNLTMFGRTGPQLTGLKGAGANMLAGGTALAATNAALNRQGPSLSNEYIFGREPLDTGQQDALRRVLGSTGRAAGGTTMLGGPVAGTMAGVGSGLMQGDVEARRWAEDQGLGAQGLVGLGESAAQMGGPLGKAAVFGGQIADSLGLSEPLADYTGAVADANIPFVSPIAGWFGGGGDGQPSDEERAAQEAEVQRIQQMQDPNYMASIADRMGLPPEARDQAIRDFNQSVDQAIALNEVGAFDVAMAGDKTVTRDPETGSWVDEDNNTVNESNVSPLSNEQVRYMMTQGFYNSLPALAAQHEAQMQRVQQAAAYQALMDQNMPEMERLYQQTADLYNQAGEPEMAANAMQQFAAQRGLMHATPLIQAVDYQQQVEEQLAAMAQQKMMNDAIYGTDNGGSDGQSAAELALQDQ